MTAGDAALVITSVASLVAAVGTYLNGRSIKLVAKHTNSMKDELVAEVRKSSYAQGKKEEKEDPSGKSA